MPSYPFPPAPYQVTPFQPIDPIYTMQVDQGYDIRRSRFSRRRRQFTMVYRNQASDIHAIMDFIERETRGQALAFDWTYPYPHTITNIANGAPNVVTTSHRHGYQTGDQAVITNTASHNGTYTIAYINQTQFSLDGTSGGASESIGNVAFHLPRAMFLFQNGTVPLPQLVHDFGPLRDNDGLFNWSIQIQETFA